VRTYAGVVNFAPSSRLLGQLRGQLPAGMPVVVNTVTGGLVLIGRVPG